MPYTCVIMCYKFNTTSIARAEGSCFLSEFPHCHNNFMSSLSATKIFGVP